MDAHDTSESPITHSCDSVTAWVASVDRRSVERHLWVIVAVALVADVHLTYVGLQHGFVEGNPVARWAIEAAGIAALASGKLAVLGIAALVRKRIPRHGPVIALGLAIPWVTAVVLNALTLS